MSTTPNDPFARPPKSPLRLIVPFAVAGFLVAAALAVYFGSRPSPHRVSDIVDRVHSIVMTRPHGWLGPWRVRAERVDALTGDMIDFTLDTEELKLGAARARVVVDAEDQSISLELYDVIFAALPGEGEQSRNNPIRSVDIYMLGPIPYGHPIVDDQRAAGRGRAGASDLVHIPPASSGR